MSKHLVVVDPGHGGQDPGALSGTGVRESDINLAIARKFKEQAGEYDLAVLLTREGDTFVSLADRAKMANEVEAVAVLSFHCNACGSEGPSGFEVWTTKGETKADALATKIYVELENVLPYSGRPDYDEGDSDREADFYVLRKTKAPAVLIEFGFMTNPSDLEELEDLWVQEIAAIAVLDALDGWIKKGVEP